MTDEPAVPAPPVTPTAATTAPSETINSLTVALPQKITLAQNTDTVLVVVNEDKARLYLRDFKEAVEAKVDYKLPAGTLGAVVTTLITADFPDTFGIPHAVWLWGYVLVALVCLVWTVWAVVRAFQKRKLWNIETVLERLKGNAT